MTPRSLRQGAWYALEQAGRLLESSTVLFEMGHSYSSSAVGLAMLGREEIGRSRILRRLAEDVQNGKTLFPKHVRKAYENHVNKQREGMFGTMLRAEAGTELHRLFRDRMDNPPYSEAWHKAAAGLKLAHQSKRKRAPSTYHDLRTRAFYIDVEESGTWYRPCDITRQEAMNEITDAVNDYADEYIRLRPGVLKDDFPEMADALETISPRVSLPLPRWPKFG
jgi:AbiV family abortive infection protein